VYKWVRKVRRAIDPDQTDQFDGRYKAVIISKLPEDLTSLIEDKDVSAALKYLESLDAPYASLKTLVNISQEFRYLPSALYYNLCTEAKNTIKDCADPDYHKVAAYETFKSRLSEKLQGRLERMDIERFPSPEQIIQLDEYYRKNVDPENNNTALEKPSANTSAVTDARLEGVYTLLNQIAPKPKASKPEPKKETNNTPRFMMRSPGFNQTRP
jgi:hypothetical protein